MAKISEIKAAIERMHAARAEAIRLVSTLQPGTSVRFHDHYGVIRRGVVEERLGDWRFAVKARYKYGARRKTRMNINEILDDEEEVI